METTKEQKLTQEGLSCNLGRSVEGGPKLATWGLACTLQEDSTRQLVLLSIV